MHACAKHGINATTQHLQRIALLQIDDKYTSRAAKMYKAHLNKLAGAAARSISDDEEEADPRARGITAPAPSHTNSTRQVSEGSSPLSTEFISVAQGKAVSAAYDAERAEAASAVPRAVSLVTPTSATSAYASLGGRKAHVADAKDASGVTLTVSPSGGAPPTPDSTGSGTPPPAVGGGEAIRRPVIVGKASSGPSKLGAKKLGASKLGAGPVVTAATTAPKLGFDDFDKDKDEVAPVTPVTPAPEMNLAKAIKDLELHSKSTAATAAAGRADATPTYSKYANSKSISSDMMYGREDDATVKQAQARLASYGGARAVSSDMVYGESQGSPEGGRYGGRAGSGTGDSMSEFVEKLGSAVGDDVRKMGSALTDKAGKLKDGMSAFMEAIRR